MELTRLKFWHWMIIGTAAGAAVGFAWSNLPNDLERTGDKEQFRRLARSSATPVKGQPELIRNIVVREPERDPSNVLVYPVTYDYLKRDPRQRLRDALARAGKGDSTPLPPAKDEYVSTGIYAPTPFDGNDSVVDFLTKRKVSFTNRSGNGKYMPVYYGAGGGFVVIGLLWPAMIQLLISVGLAKAPPPVEKKPKKEHRTGEDVDDMLVKPTAKPAVDGAALNNLNDAMEANLAGSLTSGGPRAAAVASEEPVSTLLSGQGSRSASDPTEAAPMTPEEKKDFSAGQYYPVARVTKKDDDAPKH